MKDQIDDNQPVTKKELKEVLNDYPTKNDLKEILKEYPTKVELGERIDKSFDAFRQETNYNFQVMLEKFDEKFTTFTSTILTAIDPLIKDMEIRQQERELAAAHLKHAQDDITDLQKRVTKLEQAH